jgi:proteasome lid subunit RPN8/RPN11
MGSDGIELTRGLEYAPPAEKAFPARAEPMSSIAPDDLRIFLTEEILRQVLNWSLSDLDHELGGVFVGDHYTSGGVQYIEIAGYIRAAHYQNTAASFRFTHDSWSAISREKESRFGDRRLVGWHHTHPGYGIFLSSMDLFIHRHFFDLPWMVALVVDPRQDKMGFFQWKKGKVVPCGFFFVR